MGKGSNKRQKEVREAATAYLVTASGTKASASIASQGDSMRKRARVIQRETDAIRARKLDEVARSATLRKNPKWEAHKNLNVLPTIGQDGASVYARLGDKEAAATSRQKEAAAKSIDKKLAKKEKDAAAREAKKAEKDQHPDLAAFNALYEKIDEQLAIRARKKRSKNRFDDEPLIDTWQEIVEKTMFFVPGYRVNDHHMKLLEEHEKNANAPKKAEGDHKRQRTKDAPKWLTDAQQNKRRGPQKPVTLRQQTMKDFKEDKFALEMYLKFCKYSDRLIHIIPSETAEGAKSILECNTTFNFSEQLVRLLIILANGVRSPTTKNIDETAAYIALDSLLDCVKSDRSLRFTEVLVSELYTCSKRLQERPQGPQLSHRLILLLGRLELGQKVAAAEADLTQKGLMGPSIKGMNKEFLADKYAQTASGDIKSMMKRQANCLEKIFMIFVRIITNPELYSELQLVAAFSSIEKCGDIVNHDLLNEVIEELKLIAERPLSIREDTQAEVSPCDAPAVAIHALSSILALCVHFDVSHNASAKEEDQLDDNVTDRQWTVELLVDLLPYCLPKLPLGQSGEHEIEMTSNTEKWDCNLIATILKLVHRLLLDPTVTTGAKITTGSAWVRLLRGLAGISWNLDWSERSRIEDALKTILVKMPGLVELYSPDGLQTGSTFAAEDGNSIFWTLHLIANSEYSRPPSRTFEAEIGALMFRRR